MQVDETPLSILSGFHCRSHTGTKLIALAFNNLITGNNHNKYLKNYKINLINYTPLKIFKTHFGHIQIYSTPYEFGRSLNQILFESQRHSLVPKASRSHWEAGEDKKCSTIFLALIWADWTLTVLKTPEVTKSEVYLQSRVGGIIHMSSKRNNSLNLKRNMPQISISWNFCSVLRPLLMST